jgi:hypothetical protein
VFVYLHAVRAEHELADVYRANCIEKYSGKNSTKRVNWDIIGGGTE